MPLSLDSELAAFPSPTLISISAGTNTQSLDWADEWESGSAPRHVSRLVVTPPNRPIGTAGSVKGRSLEFGKNHIPSYFQSTLQQTQSRTGMLLRAEQRWI
jgi:hypothetical protein